MTEENNAESAPFKFPIRKTAMGALSIKRRERKMWGPDADCQHEKMVIDEQLRIVLCGTCGEQLDPIECLLRWARIEYDLDTRVQYIQRFKQEQARKEEGRQRRCRGCNKLFPSKEHGTDWYRCPTCSPVPSTVGSTSPPPTERSSNRNPQSYR